MKRTVCGALIWLALALALPAGASELRAGVGAMDITPPAGMPMAGYYRVRLAEGTHDPLRAKALVLANGGSKVALVACDLVSVPREVVERARVLIEEATGIPAGAVMISATHTHTGPELGTRLTGVDEATRKLVEEYVKQLPEQIARAVEQAHSFLRPARALAGLGHEDSISFIRRFRMKDGSVGWNPGKGNPDIVHPLGEIDPAVGVIRFESPEGDPFATYVNFANHLDTVGGLHFSADYPYTLARLLGEANGPRMLTLFTIGAAGNVNHIDVRSAAPQKGHGEAARIGIILAGEVLRTFRKLAELPQGPVGARQRVLELEPDRFTPADIEKAHEVIATYAAPEPAPFLDQVRAFKVLELERMGGKPIPAEVQAIALGADLAWVGLPGEIFVELGKAIKQASPFRYTLIAELANGSVGYVPDRKAYPEGAYEVISSRLAPGGGEAMVAAAVELLIELHQAARGPH